uniref:Cyclin-dependent kinase inhibitor domain-containing protein n=1 Tax=Phlebotomus papatasi TaxID=29031 RepID=A0A1B0F0D8_PHLPP
MNVRVLTPSVIRPLSKLHSPVGRQMPKKCLLERIKKDLFGPVNQEDAKHFIQKELTKSQKEASKRWGFDFSRGEPLRDHSQFVWKRVPPTVMPEMFTLSRAAHCREIPGVSSGDASDCEDMSPEQDLMDSRAHNEHRQQEMTPACSSSRCLKKDRATRQPKITGALEKITGTSGQTAEI